MRLRTGFPLVEIANWLPKMRARDLRHDVGPCRPIQWEGLRPGAVGRTPTAAPARELNKHGMYTVKRAFRICSRAGTQCACHTIFGNLFLHRARRYARPQRSSDHSLWTSPHWIVAAHEFAPGVVVGRWLACSSPEECSMRSSRSEWGGSQN